MPFAIIRNDITKVQVDAIVNAANNSLLGGGGVDGAIHRAAGPELLQECYGLNGCETGDAKITKGYNLPAKYVIHTVGPVWRGGNKGEEAKLRSCYARSLQLAKEYGCESVAFPLISAGVYGYPKDQALQVATEEITKFLEDNDLSVTMVLFDKSSLNVGHNLKQRIQEYIDDHYVTQCFENYGMSAGGTAPKAFAAKRKAELPTFADNEICAASLEDAIAHMDKSFSEALLELIDASGKTDPQIYKLANVDRKLFNKIKNNKDYKPSKRICLAFCIALELSLEETEVLLKKAGYALSEADLGDTIVKFFIEEGIYEIFLINEHLFDYDQPLLGSV